MKTRTVLLNFRDDRQYNELPKRFQIERSTNRKKVIKLFNEGWNLKQIARIPNKEIPDLCVSDGMIVQARKMLMENKK